MHNLEARVKVAVNGATVLYGRNAQTDHAYRWFLARAAKSGGTNLGSWATFRCDIFVGGPTGPSSTPPLHSAYTERKLRLTGPNPTRGRGVRWVFTNTATETFTPTRFSLYPAEKTVDGTNVIGWFEPQSGASPVGRVLAGDTLTITWEIVASARGSREPDGATFTEEGSSQATALLSETEQTSSIREIFAGVTRVNSTQPLRNFKLELFTVPGQPPPFVTDFTNLERLSYGGNNDDGVLLASPSLVREVAGTSGTEVDRVEVRFDVPLPTSTVKPYVYRFGTSTDPISTGVWRTLRARTSPTDTEPVIFPITGFRI